MIDTSIIRYLIFFLVGVDCLNTQSGIAYTDDVPESVESPVIIRPSMFFDEDIYGTEKTLPDLPLQEVNSIPFLYGDPKIEYTDEKIIIHADLVASAYFLVSRYEEMLRPGIRDEYGRFPGKESLLYRAGFIHRPVIDEYGDFLRDMLRKKGVEIGEDTSFFGTIYLTHDVDTPWEYFNLRNAIRRTLGILKRDIRIDIYPLLNLLGIVVKDPLYTFPHLIGLDQRVQQSYEDRCKVIYFVKSGGKLKPADNFVYIKTRACKRLLKSLSNSGAVLGYHASYEAGIHPHLITDELDILEKITEQKVRYSRHHYLNSREPRDMRVLIAAGITDDFTMGYADVAGFRLGTSRCVRWIDPERLELTMLKLHPLTIMECSMSGSQYMGLSIEQAIEYANQLINQTKKHNGDLALLWHNTSMIDMPGNIDKELYEKIVDKLCNIMD